MQIHELNNFAGTPTSSDYLAIDNSTTTTKIGATGLGVQDKLTVAEANTGTSTASRIVTPKVVHDYVTGAVSDGIDGILSAATIAKWDAILGLLDDDSVLDQICDYLADNTIIEEGTSDIWHYRKYGSGLLVLDGTHAGTSGSMGGYGNGFATDEKTVSFPSMLASIYSFASGLYFNATTGYLSVSQVQASSGIKYRIAALANTSSRGYTAYFHVVGTWDND